MESKRCVGGYEKRFVPTKGSRRWLVEDKWSDRILGYQRLTQGSSVYCSLLTLSEEIRDAEGWSV